jgi:hypothetical protein
MEWIDTQPVDEQYQVLFFKCPLSAKSSQIATVCSKLVPIDWRATAVRSPMSPRSIYLRDQAAKCEWHAKNIGNGETQVDLRKLAAEYIAQAVEIEGREKEWGRLRRAAFGFPHFTQHERWQIAASLRRLFRNKVRLDAQWPATELSPSGDESLGGFYAVRRG